MLIKLLSIYCGPRGSYKPGQVVEFPEVEAQLLIDANYAELQSPVKLEKSEPEPKEKTKKMSKSVTRKKQPSKEE